MIADHLEQVRQAIAAARENAPLARDEAVLIAVSKTKPVTAIAKALAAGQRVFGENRVQEAQEKFTALKEEFDDLELHLIGPLQTNKAAEAVALFDVIHTVDRPRLVRALVREMTRQQRFPRCLVQVNTGEEPQKSGVLPADLADLLGLCQAEGLAIDGLMVIPPIDEEPALHFSFLGQLARQHGLGKLSMGMSADYELAVRFGADYVRVGSGIFGQRN